MIRSARPRFENIGELLESLGGIPADRVRMNPPPGTATRKDLLRFHERGRKLYELVDRTLVEKPMGHPESFIEVEIIWRLREYLKDNDLGYCTGADDLVEVMPRLIRGPDVSFISWRRRPERTVPTKPISELIPDLVVEVLSPRNTRAEIDRKLREYFLGGVRLAWVIDPRKRCADAYSAREKKSSIPESGHLDGGDVLPGFRVHLAKLFERLERSKPKRRKK